MMAVELNAHPGADILFSDEDKIDTDGNRYDPYFKSGVNLDLMRSYNAVNHLGVYRRALVEAAGGFREGFEGAQDYDLLLRVMDRTTPARIRHIPHILYHWRAIPGSTALSADTKDYAVDAARKALSESLHRRNMHGTVGAAAVREWHHISYALPDERPPVTLIIPTRDQLKLLKTAIDSVERTVTWPNLEIIVVDNQSSDPATLAWLAEFGKRPNRRVIRYDAPFNYAAMNNRAAAEARGLVLGLLNNDIEALEPGWLDEMVAQALRPEIGAVGAKLFYPDRTVQHAGVLIGVKGVACHAMAHIQGDHPGFMGLNLVARNVSAVTAACLVVRREVFEQVGGFDADNLPVSYNDVDLCLKIQAAGYRNLWTPAAKLVHHESVSRGEDTRPEHRERALREYGHMQARWQKALAADPYYNPNLTASDSDYGLAFPPRVTKPWQGH